MRIRSIHAQNYRTLQDLSVEFASNYCTLSGHNNAGKSNLIRLILNLLYQPRPGLAFDNFRFEYEEDLTGWINSKPPINVHYEILLGRQDDTELVILLEKLASKEFSDQLKICISKTIGEDDKITNRVMVEDTELDDVSRKSFLQRLRGADNLFLHNSAHKHFDVWLGREKTASMYDLSISQKDRRAIVDAEEKLHRQWKRAAKGHKEALESMLGELSDNYLVEFSPPDLSISKNVPLTISLGDRNIELPLERWGSGTQNRTQALVSLLRANHIKTNKNVETKITPIVLIEEPESFLHPSAQAEFGKALQQLASRLDIQVIVATHSPYMLNQVESRSNILLRRRRSYRKDFETYAIQSDGDDWMVPFADHLGIIPRELDGWRGLLAKRDKKIVLVEGDIDKEYFLFLREKFPEHFPIPDDVEIESYGGKDALKNTTALKFVLKVVDQFFITFDLDAKKELKKCLEGIELKEKKHWLAVGLDKSGKRCIEGLVPDRITSEVYAQEPELVSALMGSTDERKKAVSIIKRKILEHMQKVDNLNREELQGFYNLGNTVRKALT